MKGTSYREFFKQFAIIDILVFLYTNEMEKKKPLNQYRASIETGITYAHFARVLRYAENLGLIEKKRRGRREYIIFLTEKGRELAKKLYEIKTFIEKLVKEKRAEVIGGEG